MAISENNLITYISTLDESITLAKELHTFSSNDITFNLIRDNTQKMFDIEKSLTDKNFEAIPHKQEKISFLYLKLTLHKAFFLVEDLKQLKLFQPQGGMNISVTEPCEREIKPAVLLLEDISLELSHQQCNIFQDDDNTIKKYTEHTLIALKTFLSPLSFQEWLDFSGIQKRRNSKSFKILGDYCDLSLNNANLLTDAVFNANDYFTQTLLAYGASPLEGIGTLTHEVYNKTFGSFLLLESYKYILDNQEYFNRGSNSYFEKDDNKLFKRSRNSHRLYDLLHFVNSILQEGHFNDFYNTASKIRLKHITVLLSDKITEQKHKLPLDPIHILLNNEYSLMNRRMLMTFYQKTYGLVDYVNLFQRDSSAYSIVWEIFLLECYNRNVSAFYNTFVEEPGKERSIISEKLLHDMSLSLADNEWEKIKPFIDFFDKKEQNIIPPASIPLLFHFLSFSHHAISEEEIKKTWILMCRLLHEKDLEIYFRYSRNIYNLPAVTEIFTQNNLSFSFLMQTYRTMRDKAPVEEKQNIANGFLLSLIHRYNANDPQKEMIEWFQELLKIGDPNYLFDYSPEKFNEDLPECKYLVDHICKSYNNKNSALIPFLTILLNDFRFKPPHDLLETALKYRQQIFLKKKSKPFFFENSEKTINLICEYIKSHPESIDITSDRVKHRLMILKNYGDNIIVNTVENLPTKPEMKKHKGKEKIYSSSFDEGPSQSFWSNEPSQKNEEKPPCNHMSDLEDTESLIELKNTLS